MAKYVLDLILYGSTARGQAEFSSDVDLLMVLDDKIKNIQKYKEAIGYLKGNISPDDYSLPEVDLHVVFNETWMNGNDAFLYNVKNEGFSILSRESIAHAQIIQH